MSVASSCNEGRGELLFVIGHLEIGGTEQHILRTAPALARLGWDVSVYSLAGRGPLLEPLRAKGVEVLLPPFDRSNVRMSLPTRIFNYSRRHSICF